MSKIRKYIELLSDTDVFICGIKYRIADEDNEAYYLGHGDIRTRFDKSEKDITFKIGAIVNNT